MAQENLNLVVSAVDRATQVLGSINGTLGSLSSQMLKSATGGVALGNVISNVVTKAFQGMVSVIQDGIQGALEAETGQVKLAAAMRQSGEYTDENMEAMNALASQLQQTTAFEDDAAIAALAMGKQMGLTTAELKRALPVAADLAAGLGLDLSAAMRMVSKGSEVSATALARYGIKIENSTDSAKQFENVLAGISEKFGGQAAAATGTMQGKLDQLNNAFGNLKESIADNILSFPPFRSILEGVTSTLNSLTAETEATADATSLLGTSAYSAKDGVIDLNLVLDDYNAKTKEAAGVTEQLAEKLDGVSLFDKYKNVDELAKSFGFVTAAADQMASSVPKNIYEVANATKTANETQDAAIDILKLSRAELDALVGDEKKYMALSKEQIDQIDDRYKKFLEAEEGMLEEEKKASDARIEVAKKEADFRDEFMGRMVESSQTTTMEYDETLGRMVEVTVRATSEATDVQIAAADKLSAHRRLLVEQDIILAQEGANLILGITGGLTDALGNSFAAILQGGRETMDNLKNIWNSFGNYVLQVIGKIIAKMMIMKAATALLGAFGGAPGGILATIAKGGFQTHFGQTRQVPGPFNAPVPIIAHGGEIIGRPSGGAESGGMNVTIAGDVFGWDETMERIRSGLYNHQKMTGLSPAYGG